jgi:CTP:molybdopterin cytidylyltransferase MocA
MSEPESGVSSGVAAHGVVVLAAGESSRLGRNKLLLRHEGESLVRRAVRLALATAPADAVIVLGDEGDAVYAELQGLAIRRVDCASWREGMGASLHSGLAALAKQCAGALVVVCDQPALDAAHLEALCAAWRAAPDDAAVSHYADRFGVPALLPRAWFAALPGRGDRGAREVFASHGERISVVANEALSVDIDLVEDLGALRP